MEKSFLIFFLLFFVGFHSHGQYCSLGKTEISQLKKSLLCRSDESFRTCRQITGIGISPEALIAGEVGSYMGATEASDLWKSQVKLCKIPGFSSFWLELLITSAKAKSIECIAQDAYLENLFENLHPQIDKALQKNIETVRNQTLPFLKDEKEVRKMLLGQNPNASLDDIKKVIELSKKISISPNDAESLQNLGLPLEKIKELVEFKELHANKMQELQKLSGQHRQMVLNLRSKGNLTAAETKNYADLVKKIPGLNQSTQLTTKLNSLQLTALAKTAHAFDKINEMTKIDERLTKEALVKAVSLVSREAASHVVPVVNVYSAGKDGVEAAETLYDLYVSSAGTCSQTFSKYTVVDEQCNPVKGKHLRTLQFLSEDWKTQEPILHGDQALCENIKTIYDEFVKPPYKVSCTNNGFVADSLHALGGIQIRGYKSPKGNLQKLVFEASQLNQAAVDNRTFAITFKKEEMDELRYLQLSPATALRYRAGTLTNYLDQDEKEFQYTISNFENPQYYKSYFLKKMDPDAARPRALNQIQENNFYITEILGCCDVRSALPGVQRCREYGIQRQAPIPRQKKAGSSNL